MNDFETLTRINEEINTAEDAGVASELDKALGSFAFRRASGAVVDRGAYLASAAKSGPRELTIRSISLLGRDRALVTCVISMPVNGVQASFDNVRLFVRDHDEWKLLGWANERI